MTEAIEILDGIYRIETPVGVSKFPPTAFLIRDAGVLIEPGPSICAPAIHETLGRLGIDTLRYIIPTHIHMDHAGGTGALAAMYPEAIVPVHPRGARHAADPSRLIDSVKMVWGEHFEDAFGPITAVPEERIRTVDDGEAIRAGDRELQFIYTPGHAPHHIAIHDRKAKALFCGEALGMPGSQLPPAAPMSFDLKAYLDTIEHLQRLDIEIESLVYSHGGVEAPPQTAMQRARENALAIGDIVLDALKAGVGRVDIGREVRDYIEDRFDVEIDEQGLGTIATGYIIYFEKIKAV